MQAIITGCCYVLSVDTVCHIQIDKTWRQHIIVEAEHELKRNITAGLWVSVVNLSLKHGYGIFQTFSLKTQYLETSKLILQ